MIKLLNITQRRVVNDKILLLYLDKVDPLHHHFLFKFFLIIIIIYNYILLRTELGKESINYFIALARDIGISSRYCDGQLASAIVVVRCVIFFNFFFFNESLYICKLYR